MGRKSKKAEIDEFGSLVDAIYDANTEEIEGYTEDDYHDEDEYGIPIWNKVDYYVVRSIMISIRERESEYTIRQLHLRNGVIHYGDEEVEENWMNIYRFSRSNKRMPQFWFPEYWRKLKMVLPKFDSNIYQISDNLFWDKRNGKIIEKENLL